MANERVERRLAAILAADVAGYSRLMGRDEVGTLQALTARREIMDRIIAEHRGRIANTAGDSVLAEFPSVVEAVQCAAIIQQRLADADAEVPADARLRFRIGIHVGDVIVKGGDLFGDDVNIAARLQSLAEPGGLWLSARAYEEIEGKLPLSFEDRGEQEVRNVGRRIRAYALAGSFAGARERPLPLPEKPSIAVLPFTNMSGDPEQDYVADGIVEEIIAALSRVRGFFVVSRNSTFTYKGRAVDPRQVSREVGVRYVLEGSVRRSGQRLRIGAQLVDAASGTQVWSQRYDGESADVFDLQDRVTEAVVGAIEPRIALSEIERARRKRPDSLSAYDCVMRALPAIWSQDPETTEDGLRLAEAAMTLDPNYALPRALAAWCHAQRLAYLRTKNAGEDRSRAIALARDAVRLADDDPLVLTCAGAAYSITRELALAQALIEKALRLDPNLAWAWHRSGWINVYTREPDRALEHFRRAMRLSPVDPLMFNIYIGMGAAYLDKGEYDEAARWIEKGLREKPDAVWANRILAATYFHGGRIDEARRAFAALLEKFPDLTVSNLLERTPGSDVMRAKFAEAFRALGLPE
ncbi:MAG TPA: adenylate/guanylate cyclase domain-containing protein [Microvirga sp.]|nr:adenylate/guanylate cyclase domain-containing protein [Microvirga sp.]